MCKGSTGGSRAGLGSGREARQPCQEITVGTSGVFLSVLLVPDRGTVWPSMLKRVPDLVFVVVTVGAGLVNFIAC